MKNKYEKVQRSHCEVVTTALDGSLFWNVLWIDVLYKICNQ